MTPAKSLTFGSAVPTAGQPSVILVVEDEDLVRQSTADFLRMSDFGVVEAPTADAAIELLTAGAAVDLVFSDVRMPGRHNGFELADWINAHHPALPVLLTSGYAGERSAQSVPAFRTPRRQRWLAGLRHPPPGCRYDGPQASPLGPRRRRRVQASEASAPDQAFASGNCHLHPRH